MRDEGVQYLLLIRLLILNQPAGSPYDKALIGIRMCVSVNVSLVTAARRNFICHELVI